MEDIATLRPSDSASWSTRIVPVASGRFLNVRLLEAAAGGKLSRRVEPPVFFCLPERPLLRDQGGQPVLSLTLMLSRLPQPDEASIHHLITQGVLAFDAMVAVPVDAMTELQRDVSARYRPLFLRNCEVALETAAGESLAMFTATGDAAQGALHAALNRSQALGALAALDGAASGLVVRARVAFGVADTDRTIRLHGSWAEVHDWLRARAASGTTLFGAELRGIFDAMVEAQVIQVFIASADEPEQAVLMPDAQQFGIFRSLMSVVLDRTTPEREPADPQNLYVLRHRPSPYFGLDASETVAGGALRREDSCAPLEDVLGGCLQGRDREQFIHLVSVNGTGRGDVVRPVPRRVRSSRADPLLDNPAEKAVRRFVADAGRLESIALVLKPDATMYRPQDMLVSQVAGHAWVDDVLLVNPDAPQWRHLPCITDAEAPLWADQADARMLWYAPDFELVAPDPISTPESSPFLFTYTAGGMTQSGKRALRATIRCSLRPVQRADTKAALQSHGGAVAQSVPLSDLSVSLELPFVDDRDGQTKVQSLAMEIIWQGERCVATVELINDWVGLAYGALAQPGFQKLPAQLKLTYSVEGYVPVKAKHLQIAYGGKVALTRINYSDTSVAELQEPYLDAKALAYRFPGGEVRMVRETQATDNKSAPIGAPRQKSQIEGNGNVMTVTRQVVSATLAQSRPLSLATAMSAAAPITIRPALEVSPALADIVERTEFMLQRLLRQASVDALYPCASLGSLYREMMPEGSVAIGCRDALQLGQTTYRQFEEIADLRHPLYRVHRSLQQPSQFLVVPAYYRVTRYAATAEGKAYRPILYLYSVLDAQVATNSRVVLHATLQPDIPVYARRDLLSRLASYAGSPVLVYPTQIPATLETVLAVDSGIREQPQVIQFPDSFQVVLATDVPGARLLRTRLETDAIPGSVIWTLPDGSLLSSALSLALDAITGPMEGGPVEISPTATGARLINRIERPIAVSDVLIYGPTGVESSIPVETVLARGASTDVAFDAAAGELVPVYTLAPGDAATLSEVRSFIEEIHTNVIFLDLIDHVQHGLQSLQVFARLEGVDGTYSVRWTAGVGNVEILLPLTTELDQRLLHYQVIKNLVDGEVVHTPWLDWDLANGNVVSLTWPLIQ